MSIDNQYVINQNFDIFSKTHSFIHLFITVK